MKIFVCTHKKIDNKLPKNYEYIQVNALNNGKQYPLTDADCEDNISVKNPYFCELTACYYIWKNIKDEEIVGLAHYRRFFTTNKFSSSIKSYVNSPTIEKKLGKYDFITPKLFKTKETVKEHLLINVSEHDFDLLRESILKICPEYLVAFDEVMNGNETYLLNMFITTKQKWNDYYKWLFEILFDLEKKVDMTGYTIQQQRLYGFLSERLFTVYVKKNNFKTFCYSTHIVGERMYVTFKNKMKRLLK